MAEQQIYLGVDGGATRCRVRARDAEGAWLAEVEGPPANIYVDFDGAMAAVLDILDAVLNRIKPLGPAKVYVGAGLAGISSGKDEARVAAQLCRFGNVVVANDAVTACLGANGGGDGGVVIAGTGSNAVAQVGGIRTVVGGRGFIAGDDGSAAHIGYDALRAALRAHDGIEPVTPLAQRLMAKFDNDPVAVVEWAARAKPGDYGGLAPIVFEAAHAGDGLALKTIGSAAAAIGALARAVRRLGAERIALVGGLSEAILPFLAAQDAALFSPALLDPTDGAILLVGGAVQRSG
jgi:glucosamine kinase